MKKFISLAVLVLISTCLWGQETLTFKMSKPRIEFYSPDNYFVFEVYVKATANGTYLYGSQITCNVTISNVNTSIPLFILKGLVDGTFDPPGPSPAVDKYGWTANYNSNYLNIFIGHTLSVDSYYPSAYSAITTSFQLLCSVYVPLLPGAVSNTAGISFNLTAMGSGNQTYATSTAPYNAPYNDPNSYGNDFSDLYYGRIFSGSYGGWSEWNGTLDWTNYRNTSVWDTTSNATAITSSGSHAAALRIHNGARLAINAGADLTCSGVTDINNPKGLWIASSSSGTGSFIDNGTINYNTGGSALVERYLTPGKWHGYCVPFTSTSVIPYRGVYMKYWTESNHNYHYIIVPAPADSTLTGAPFRGYMDWTTVSSGITKVYPVGQLNTGFIQSIGATRTDMTQQYPGNGYNLLGNPYPSGLDLSTGVNWNLLDQKAWVWNPTGTGPDGGNYVVYIVAGGGTHSKYIPPEQGFFVHHVDVSIGSTTLDLTNAARTHTLTENFMKDGLPDLISLKAYSLSNESEDIANVYFTPGATLGYDEFLDADKITGGNAAPQLYSIITDRNLTVNAIPWTGSDQIVPLGFSCGVSGNYTITGSNIESFRLGTDVVLEDLKESRMQSLKLDSIYTFSYQKGESSSRFILHFSNPYYGVPGQDANAIHVYSFEEYVYVKINGIPAVQGTISIFDQLGRIVFSDKLENAPVNKFKPGLIQGYYVVMVKTDQFLVNKKIYLK
jgi:hypothetical protein